MYSFVKYWLNFWNAFFFRCSFLYILLSFFFPDFLLSFFFLSFYLFKCPISLPVLETGIKPVLLRKILHYAQTYSFILNFYKVFCDLWKNCEPFVVTLLRGIEVVGPQS